MLAVLGWLVVANGVTLLLFRHDKAAARAGLRRVPEATLLAWAAGGGTPGAFLARRLFRHKTRKQPFSDRLQWIAVLQAAVVIGAVIGL
jgi:uncharacterized membrane protein YsdA (DUF1294 family)